MPEEIRKEGLTKGKFYPCPERPVCVSSMAPKNDKKHYMEPMTYSSSFEEAKEKIKKVVKSFNRTEIINEKDNYIHTTFTTFVFHFTDDVEFLIDDSEKVIHFKSQSRAGDYDWGKNKRRMKKVKKKFDEIK
ncbi:MAG: DUF1499 domain-containing protein [Promethearchaeota archaeon]|nr:MAG: DUF1499 domain-containing protein [Candidatus Lokiarchaeota archaeon]